MSNKNKPRKKYVNSVTTKEFKSDDMPDSHYLKLLMSQFEGIKVALYGILTIHALYVIFIVVMSAHYGW